MRAIALTLVAAAPVLAPADPPQTGEPSGVAAAGDVIAFDYDRRIEAFAGGTPVRIAGDGPAVAAASDGTAIVASISRGRLVARIRRPGAGFGRTIRVGGNAREYRVAAASGGWTAAAWLSPASRRVTAAVIDPAGTVTPIPLERGKDLELSAPQVGIDRLGEALVGWTFSRRHARPRVTFARSSSAGRYWTRVNGEHVNPGSSQVAVAVTPGGRALLAWATRDAVRAAIDHGAARTLAAVRGAGSPAVSLAEDGSAVVAYAAASKVYAFDRAQNGPWSAPQAIGGAADHDPASVLAADGRAFVAWASFAGAAVAVRTGGAWTAAQVVSSPVRLADPPLVALDAAGNPFALWHEFAQSTLAGRIHGARLAPPGAPLPDTTPPKLTTRLPERVEVAKDGAFSFRIPVSCDEACDVRVVAGDFDLRELSLPAGGNATVRISPSPYDERAEVRRRRPTQMRIVVEAADRAGNLATATATARVHRR